MLGHHLRARASRRASQGDADGCVGDLRRRTEIQPESRLVWVDYANVLAHLGRREESLAALRRARDAAEGGDRAEVEKMIEALEKGG